MKYTFDEIRNKEVINVRSGGKLGYVDDIEFDSESLMIKSLIIFGRCKLWGLWGREDDTIIKCRDIEMIGTDTILVSSEETKAPKKIDLKIKSLCK